MDLKVYMWTKKAGIDGVEFNKDSTVGSDTGLFPKQSQKT